MYVHPACNSNSPWIVDCELHKKKTKCDKNEIKMNDFTNDLLLNKLSFKIYKDDSMKDFYIVMDTNSKDIIWVQSSKGEGMEMPLNTFYQWIHEGFQRDF